LRGRAPRQELRFPEQIECLFDKYSYLCQSTLRLCHHGCLTWIWISDVEMFGRFLKVRSGRVMLGEIHVGFQAFQAEVDQSSSTQICPTLISWNGSRKIT
jgi:hypothetical protein